MSIEEEMKLKMAAISGIPFSSLNITLESSHFISGTWASTYEYVMARQGHDWSSAKFFIFKRVHNRGEKPYRILKMHGAETVVRPLWEQIRDENLLP